MPNKACKSCWFLLDEKGKRVRAMLPNDDSKYLELVECDCCKAENARHSGIFANSNLRRYTAATI